MPLNGWPSMKAPSVEQCYGHLNFKVIRRFTVNLCPSQLGLKHNHDQNCSELTAIWFYFTVHLVLFQFVVAWQAAEAMTMTEMLWTKLTSTTKAFNMRTTKTALKTVHAGHRTLHGGRPTLIWQPMSGRTLFAVMKLMIMMHTHSIFD